MGCMEVLEGRASKELVTFHIKGRPKKASLDFNESQFQYRSVL
jgi:hypothetical protein